MSKLNTVRKGDKAEYITQGVFSALGYSMQTLRQEDFGIDFICTLTERDIVTSYPTKSFTVQLKTNHENIVYSVKNAPKIKWLLENKLPFFLCYFDSVENRVDFFSTSLLHRYTIIKPHGVTKISFRRELEIGSCVLQLGEHKKGRKIFNIELGKPFLSISLGDLADEKIIEQRKVTLNKVVDCENQNIVYRNLKLPFMRWLHNYETNSENILFGWVHFNDENIIRSDELLESVGHIMISLCSTYKAEGRNKEYNSLKEFVLKLPFDKNFKSSLINMGFRDQSGNPL